MSGFKKSVKSKSEQYKNKDQLSMTALHYEKNRS